jgi:hypothetical protein
MQQALYWYLLLNLTPFTEEHYMYIYIYIYVYIGIVLGMTQT